MNLDTFKTQLANADRRVAKSITHLSRVLDALAANFIVALQAHNQFLGQIHAAPEPDPTILFEIALTLLAGGLGAKVAEVVKGVDKKVITDAMKPYFSDGFKDGTKLLVKDAGGHFLKVPAARSSAAVMSSDPTSWALTMKSWAENDMEYLQGLILCWSTAITYPDKNPGFKADFNPDAVIQSLLVIRSGAIDSNLEGPHYHSAKRDMNSTTEVVAIDDIKAYSAGDPEQIRRMKCAMLGHWVKNKFPAMSTADQFENRTLILEYAARIHDHYNLGILWRAYQGLDKKAAAKLEKEREYRLEHPRTFGGTGSY